MSELPMKSAWHATLDLRFQCLDGRTRLTHRRHSGPLAVQRAFYPESRAADAPVGAAAAAGEPCHVYLLHPPGGVAGGDVLDIEAHVGPDAHALLTTPAAGKFYRSEAAGGARLAQSLRVEAGVLEWLPQENIFYPGATARLSCVVRLSSGARFIGWEISCLGLPAHGLTLQSGALRQNVELWRDGRPLLLEHLMLDEACQAAAWGLAGHAAMGTCMAYPAGARERAAARAAAATACARLTVACTLVDEVLICRAVGGRADQLRLAFIDVWRAVRPSLLGREAALPRIWTT